MSIPTWGLLLIVLGAFVWLYLLASARIDEEESWTELRREIDRAVPVWSRPALYDWAETGEFE